MEKISELRNILGDFFHWHNARLDCFTRMLLALFSVRTVYLSEIAIAFVSKAEVSSRYRRLSRFFKDFQSDYDLVAQWIFRLFLSRKKIYLTIDRTNWFWGKAKINILTLAIAYEGVAIPILWRLLDKAGNATAQEHQEVIGRFIASYPAACRGTLHMGFLVKALRDAPKPPEMSKSQYYNFLSIELFELLGNACPSQEQIDFIEKEIRNFSNRLSMKRYYDEEYNQ